jgi:hypothetical protein
MVSKTSPEELTAEENTHVTNLFVSLLAGYARSSKRITTNAENKIKTLSDLLEGFADRLRLHSVIQNQHDRSALLSFIETIAGFSNAKSTWRQRQRSVADSFNILAVLKLTGNEVRHSMVLAWLLDKDMDRHGTHAQGRLGFEEFLKALALPINYAEANYWVRREVSGDESRIDIEIAARSSFLIYIEIKIWSDEGDEQTAREWADLKKRAISLNVPADHVHGIYLTPDGRTADHKDFKPLSWHKIETVLESFADKALPSDVKLFARHYARALRVGGISQNLETGERNDE